MKFLIKNQRDFYKKGYSLVELLVVVSVILILSSIVSSQIERAQAVARDAVRADDMKTLQLALEQYYFEHGRFPCNASGYHYEDSVHNNDFLSFLVAGGYIPQGIKDPLNSESQVYFYGFELPFLEPGDASTCGHVGFLWYWTETGKCPLGKLIGTNHCHIFAPRTMNCSDPYLVGESYDPVADSFNWGSSDCEALH